MYPVVPAAAASPAAWLPAAPSTTAATQSPATVSVLQIVNGEHFAGAERVQSHLARRLPESGVRSDFVCVKPGRFADTLEAAGGRCGRVYRLPMRNRVDVSVALRVARIVRRERYDLLHAHTPRTALVAAAASRISGAAWIYHVHSPAARDSDHRWRNACNAWIERCALTSCSQLITVSNSLRGELLAAGWPGDMISVVHNGVPAVRPARRHVPRPGGRWTLGMVALMRPRKGLEVALQALRRLVDAGDDVVLRCIGPFETEPYRQAIVAQVRALDLHARVQFTGFAEDVPAALSELDALLLPSLYGEGLPMVVLEAMAAGLPVIATRVEGTPEAIRDGHEGLLAEPGSAAELANAAHQLIVGQYDWTAMAEAGCRRHAAHFSDAAMAAATAAVYRGVLGQRGRESSV